MLRGRLRPRLALVPALLALASCQLASARIHNLEELHDSSGSPQRLADLHGDLEHLLLAGFEHTNFGGEDFRQGLREKKRVADPYGACLENVLALASVRRDERVAMAQAMTFAWLAVDCTYVLSRERCVLELGEVLADIGLGGTPVEVPAEPASPEQVGAAIGVLIEALRGWLAAPALGSAALDEACGALAALPLDREGALRGTRAAQVLLDGRERVAALAGLHRLRLDLARRCAGQAVLEARQDASGRVRAAALRVGVQVFPDQRGAWLRSAVAEFPLGVTELDELWLAALDLLARNGLPPGEGDDATRLAAWNEALIELLLRQGSGRVSLAVTRALARLNDRPREPRPEVWLTWWRAQGAHDSPVGEG
jgi:hypothetical protein